LVAEYEVPAEKIPAESGFMIFSGTNTIITAVFKVIS